MHCWYFHFEGLLNDPDAGHIDQKLFSSALVPAKKLDDAKKLFAAKLCEFGVELVEIEEEFGFNFDTIDRNDSDNASWISWYEEVEKFKIPVFTPWMLFDD